MRAGDHVQEEEEEEEGRVLARACVVALAAHGAHDEVGQAAGAGHVASRTRARPPRRSPTPAPTLALPPSHTTPNKPCPCYRPRPPNISTLDRAGRSHPPALDVQSLFVAAFGASSAARLISPLMVSAQHCCSTRVDRLSQARFDRGGGKRERLGSGWWTKAPSSQNSQGIA
jgi:hypothetical protein